LNSARIVISLIFVVQAAVLTNTHYFLRLLGQPEETIGMAQTYILYLLPGTFLYMHFECSRRFLFCQGEYTAVMWVMVATCFLHLINLYLLVIVYGWGIQGAAFATTLTYSCNFIFLMLYQRSKPNIIASQKWFWADSEAIGAIPEFLKFAVPA